VFAVCIMDLLQGNTRNFYWSRGGGTGKGGFRKSSNISESQQDRTKVTRPVGSHALSIDAKINDIG